MTIARALGAGAGAVFIRKRMWVLFYAVTTLWAVAAVAPVMALLFATLGDSAWAARMAGNFDLQFVAELVFGNAGGLPFATLIAAGGALLAVAVVAHLFLLGGAIQLFCAHEPFTLSAFFQGCGRHFWRFVRLALFSAVFYIAVLALSRGLNALGNKIWGEGSVETPLVYWSWFRTALILALFGLVNLCFDYARIRLVAEDSRKAARACLASIQFVWRNLGRTAGLYLLLWLMWLIIVAAYRGIAEVLSAPTMGMVLLLFLIRQITVLARMGVQLLFYSSQSEMYLALAPPPVVAPVEPAIVEPPPVAEPEPTVIAEETPTTPEPER